MHKRLRIQQTLANLYSNWPVLLIFLGLCLMILSLLVDRINSSLSPEIGPRQVRLIIIGALSIFAGSLLLWQPKSRMAIEVRFRNYYVWLYSDHTEKQAWITASILAMFIFGIFVTLFSRRYDYIDDPPLRDSVMSNVALLFSANVMRQLLFFLYSNFPALPWYGIAIYCVMTISLIIVLYLIITQKSPLFYRLLLFALLLSMYIPFMVRASYNYASSIPGGIAFILLFNSWKKKDPDLLQSLWIGFLLAVSFIFRRDGIKIGILYIAVPVLSLFIVEFFKTHRSIKHGFLLLGSIILFFVPLVFVQVIDEFQYRTVLSEQEQYHRTSNRSRSAYYGQPLLLSEILEDEQLLDVNGWNSNDIVIAEYGMTMFDENKFAADRFWNIFNEEVGLSKEESGKGIQGFLYNILRFGKLDKFQWFTPGWIEWNEHWQYWPYYTAMLTLTFITIIWSKDKLTQIFAPLLLVYFYFISVYMLNYMRFPRHIAVPPMVLICLALFVCIDLDFSRLLASWRNKVLVGLALCGLFISLFGFMQLNWQSDQEILIKRTAFVNIYKDFAERFGSEAFIFVRPPLYLNYFVDPLGDQGPDNQYSFLNVSSTAYSPMLYEYIDQYGLDYGYQILPWMVDNPKAFFASTEKWMIDRVAQFILETYDIQVEMIPVHRYDTGLTIYQLIGQNYSVPHFEVLTSLIDEFEHASIQAPDVSYVYPTTMTLNSDTRNTIFAHPESNITYRLIIPPLARLAFGIGFTPEAWLTGGEIGNGVRFSVYVENETRKELIFSRYIDPKNSRADRNWFDFDLDLSEWSGQEVDLIFVTQAGPSGDNTNDWAGWSEPKIGQWSYLNFTQKFYLASPTPKSLDQVRVRRILVGDTYQNAIFEHPTNRIAFPVTVLPNTRLDFSIGIDPTLWTHDQGDGVQFDILVSQQDGTYRRIYSRYVNPVQFPLDRRWFKESVDLSMYANQELEIIFATYPGPNSDFQFDWAYWVNPQLKVEEPDA